MADERATDLELTRRAIMSLPLAAGLFATGAEAETTEPTVPRVFRIFDGEDGLTHSEQITFEVQPGVLKGAQVLSSDTDKTPHAPAYATKTLFTGTGDININLVAPSDDAGHWHYGNRLELVCLIRGAWEFKTRDGKTLILVPGDFLWATDNAGKGGGHTTRVTGKEWGLFVAVFL